jgi:hypothetical protein
MSAELERDFWSRLSRKRFSLETTAPDKAEPTKLLLRHPFDCL